MKQADTWDSSNSSQAYINLLTTALKTTCISTSRSCLETVNFSSRSRLNWWGQRLGLVSVLAIDVSCPFLTTEFHTRLNKGQAIGASLQKIWKNHGMPISMKIKLMKTLVWPVATYSCESWTLRKNEETHPDAFEMKGLRKILRVS